MKIKLNEEQLGFLKSELDIAEEDINSMTEERWLEIRLKCFDIETDELLDFANPDECETDRYLLASSIIDYEAP